MANFGMGWIVWLHGDFLCGFKSEMVHTLTMLPCSIEGNQPIHPYWPSVMWTSSSKLAWDISSQVWDSTYKKSRCPRREHTPDESLSLNYPNNCSQSIFSCTDADYCLIAVFRVCFQNIILIYGSTAQMRTDARADFMQRLILFSNLAYFLTTAFFPNCKTYFKCLF